MVVNKNTLEIIESVNEKNTVNYPYIPGLFMLIEGKPLLRIIRLLKNQFDVLIIDGHGILYPSTLSRTIKNSRYKFKKIQ